MTCAYLFPPVRKEGVPYTGRYSVSFECELIVKASRDPETDLARVLLARSIAGEVKVLDADTGRHRTTVNIEAAAKLRTVETSSYPRFRKFNEACAGAPSAGEEDLVLPILPNDVNEAA